VNNTIFNEFSPLQKLLLFIGVTFLSSLVFSFVGIQLAKVFFNVSLVNLSEPDLKLNNHIRALKLLTLFSHLGTFIFPSIILMYVIKDSLVNFFIKEPLNKKVLIALPVLFIGVSLLSEWSLFLNQQIDFELISSSLAHNIKISQAERDLTIQAFIGGTWSSLLVNVFLIALIPAIGEELTFRGVLQPLFIKLSTKKHASILFVAFVFAFIHFQFLDFLPRFVLGIIYGYIYFYSKNIFTTIILHFSNNLLALLVVFYSISMQQEISLESNGNILILLFGSTFTIGGIYLLRKSKNRI
jgi:membrane protease YdiL (CAAX protease family)